MKKKELALAVEELQGIAKQFGEKLESVGKHLLDAARAEIIEQPKSTTIAVRCGVVSLEGVSFIDSYDEIAVQDVIDMYNAIQQLKGGDNA